MEIAGTMFKQVIKKFDDGLWGEARYFHGENCFSSLMSNSLETKMCSKYGLGCCRSFNKETSWLSPIELFRISFLS